MKKLTVTLLMLVALGQCMQATVRNHDAAMRIARTYLDAKRAADGDEAAPAAAAIRKAPLRNLHCLQDAEVADTLGYYIFNAEDAFCIVSTVDDGNPILAYSTEAPFDTAHISPIAQWLLDSYSRKAASHDGSRQAAADAPRRVNGTGRLLTTANFGQNGDFWDDYCPLQNGQQTMAGCGASAIAIIMKYHNWPRHGLGTASYTWNNQTLSVDFSAQTYDWAAIPTTSITQGGWTAHAQDEVAKILYHAGLAISMDYGVSGSSSISTDIGPGLIDHFKYKVLKNQTFAQYGYDFYQEWRSDYSESGWQTMMRNEIDNDRPFFVGGDGHFFVCDGYDDSGLFHFNLGWGGYCNGYYSVDSAAGYNVQFAVIGIEPDTTYTDETDSTATTVPDAAPAHMFVDLGLSSGRLWATTNVGADQPEDFGGYYAWGETSTKYSCDWSTYRYSDSNGQNFTKYTSYSAVLSASDDAATANWGADWRMPTMTEWNELIRSCTWTYTTVNGIVGYRVTGPNGNSIFLPQAGMQNYQFHTNTGQGRYWSSTLCYNDVQYASYMLFDSEGPGWYMVNRSYGHSVRPVYQGAGIEVQLQTQNLTLEYDGQLHALDFVLGDSLISRSDVTVKIVRTLNGQSSQVSASSVKNAATYTYTFTVSKNGYRGTATGMLTILPKQLTAVVDNCTKLYGDSNPSFGAAFSGFAEGEDATVMSGLRFYTDCTQSSPVGEYDITLTGQSNTNYYVTAQPGVLTVTPAPLCLVAKEQSRSYGEENPELTFECEGLKNNESSSVLTSQPTLSCSATAWSEVGDYPIQISGGAAPNYTVSNRDGLLHVVKAQQQIIWNQPLESLYEGDTVLLTAEASTGMPVHYSVSNALAEIISDDSGDRLVCLASGNLIVEATQSGDSRYASAVMQKYISILRKEYRLTVSSADAEMGTAEGGGIYFKADNAVISAISNSGYHFTQWQDGNTDNPRIVVIACDSSFTAGFAINTYRLELSVNAEEMGIVKGAGLYEHKSIATCEAIAVSGYEFVEWSDGSAYNPYSFVMLGDVSLQAVFRRIQSGLDNTSAAPSVEKFFLDGILYIRRGEHLYDANGRMIE